MLERVILIVDAVINLLLGILLLAFSPALVRLLGIPASPTAFYANILGAIFVGITIALLIGAFGNRTGASSGLGLYGAVSINLCGGVVLALWLLFGGLALPARGIILLWSLVGVLVILSLLELLHVRRRERG